MNIKIYKYLFTRLATVNADLQHTEEKPAYFFVKDKYDTEAFDNALSYAGSNALLLEAYSRKDSDNNNRNYFKQLLCRFTVLASAEIGSQETIDDAQEKSENIAEEIIFKLREIFEQGAGITMPENGGSSGPLFFKLNDVMYDPVGPMNTNYYGVTVGFTLNAQLKAKSNPQKWPGAVL